METKMVETQGRLKRRPCVSKPRAAFHGWIDGKWQLKYNKIEKYNGIILVSTYGEPSIRHLSKGTYEIWM